MNWVDWIIILILVFFSLEGIGKPFIFEIVDLLSFIVSFSVSLEFFSFFSQFIKQQFNLPGPLSDILGFIFLWYILEGLLYLITRNTILKNYHLLKFRGDEYLSMIPAFFKGLIFVSILLVMVGAFPLQTKIKRDIQGSTLSLWILNQTNRFDQPLKQMFNNLASSNDLNISSQRHKLKTAA